MKQMRPIHSVSALLKEASTSPARYRATSLRVAAAKGERPDLPVNIEGDVLGTLPAEFAVRPRALRVLCPEES